MPDYPRFEESLTKQALKQVVIEPVVINDEGKPSVLVARTKEPGRVTLLISASSLKDRGYLNHPDTLLPVLAREFQWVVSKADTAPKAKAVAVERNLERPHPDGRGDCGSLCRKNGFGSSNNFRYLSADGRRSEEPRRTSLVRSRQFRADPADSRGFNHRSYDIRIREAAEDRA